MAEPTTAPYGRKTQREPAVKEVHVLWTPDGLGCVAAVTEIVSPSQLIPSGVQRMWTSLTAGSRWVLRP